MELLLLPHSTLLPYTEETLIIAYIKNNIRKCTQTYDGTRLEKHTQISVSHKLALDTQCQKLRRSKRTKSFDNLMRNFEL